MGVYADIISEISTRLNYHVGSGKMLDGYSYTAVPIVTVDGIDDLPAIRLFVPNLSETYKPKNQGNSSMTANILVSIKREDGVPAVLTAIEKVMDAIETNTSDVIDPGLAGNLLQPLNMQIRNTQTLQNSVNAELSIEVTPKVFGRGNRRQL